MHGGQVVAHIRKYRVVGLVVLLYVSLLCLPDCAYRATVFNNFKGNLLSGGITSLVFLLIAVYLNKGMERTVAAINDSVSEMRTIQTDWKRERDAEWDIKHFDEFMEKEDHYEIRLTGTKFIYRIQPVREHGKPKVLGEGKRGLYVVKVVGPAHANVMSKEQLDEYKHSGIKTGEFYFCKFMNWSWHMNLMAGGGDWKPFYMSGRSYGFGVIPSANDFVGAQDAFKGMEEVMNLNFTVDGEDAEEAIKTRFEVNVYEFGLWKDKDGQTWLRTRNAPPKKVYYTNSQSDETHWHLVIENFDNYLGEDKTRKFIDMLKRKAGEKQIEIPKIDWWHFQ
jgi:hypothetical protein